jgi:hypothetical protein
MRGPAWPYLSPVPLAPSRKPRLSLRSISNPRKKAAAAVQPATPHLHQRRYSQRPLTFTSGGTTSDPSPPPSDWQASHSTHGWLPCVLRRQGRRAAPPQQPGRRGGRGLRHADAAPPHASAAHARRLRLHTLVARHHAAPNRCGLARRHAALHEHREQPARLLLQWGRRLLLRHLILVLHGSRLRRDPQPERLFPRNLALPWLELRLQVFYHAPR